MSYRCDICTCVVPRTTPKITVPEAVTYHNQPQLVPNPAFKSLTQTPDVPHFIRTNDATRTITHQRQVCQACKMKLDKGIPFAYLRRKAAQRFAPTPPPSPATMAARYSPIGTQNGEPSSVANFPPLTLGGVNFGVPDPFAPMVDAK